MIYLKSARLSTTLINCNIICIIDDANKWIIEIMFQPDDNRILSYKNILPLMDNAVLFNLIVNSKNKGDDRFNIMVFV